MTETEFSVYDGNLIGVFCNHSNSHLPLRIRLCPATYANSMGVEYIDKTHDTRDKNKVIAEIVSLNNDHKTSKRHEVIYFNFTTPAEEAIAEMQKLPDWVWYQEDWKEIIAGAMSWANGYEKGRLASILLSKWVHGAGTDITLPKLPETNEVGEIKKFIQSIE